MTLPPIFRDEYYAHWRNFDANHWWTAGMRDVASSLIDLARLPRNGVMLDVGCGSGQGMHWFAARYPDWTIDGMDLGMSGLVAAKASGLRRVALGTATSLPIAGESVDLAIALDLLQHLPLGGGDDDALREVHRVLKPGGHLFVRTNVQSFPRVKDDPEAVWHKYDVEELRDKLGKAGFTVVRLSRINALLGLAEIPSELRRARQPRRHTAYDIVPAEAPPVPNRVSTALKRGILRIEGRAVRAGLRLPMGRALVALCRRAD